MSIIRCLSNPEGLYIIYSSNGVEIMRPYPEETICVNEQDFDDFMSGAKVSMPIYREHEYKNLKVYSTEDFKTCLEIDGKKIIMWDVTWFYIVNNMGY